MERPKRSRFGIRELVVWLAGVLAVVGVAGVFWISSRGDRARELLLSRIFEGSRVNAKGCREFRDRDTGLWFVEIPNEQFLIGKHEVTWGTWTQVMGDRLGNGRRVDFPVDEITWEEGREFCRRTGFCLPTLEEWRVARGAIPDDLLEVGWFAENSPEKKPSRVGAKPANEYGIHDMLGNVKEWTDEWIDEADGDMRALVGGSYRSKIGARPLRRNFLPGTKFTHAGIGFRVAFRM